MVDLPPRCPLKRQQIILPVGGEHLHGDGLEQVAPLVNLFDIVEGKLGDLAFGFDLRHLAGDGGKDGVVLVGGDEVDVVHLPMVDNGEAVDDVEMLLAE